jgi:hypothetical protein
MRFALDGLPRDLPLSKVERRRLVERMSRLKEPRPPIWVAFIPAGAMLLAMALWMPAIYVLHDPWRWVMIGAVLLLQIWLSLAIMPRVLWPCRCRWMAAAGCEVCPRCGYLQRNSPPSVRTCSECGAARIDIPA